MIVSEAWAQGGGAAAGPGIEFFVMLAGMAAIMYFLLIRPRQKQVKEHKAMVENLRRGDVVITSGGFVGKVSKIVDDREIEVELAKDVKVRLIRQMVSEVRSKTEPSGE